MQARGGPLRPPADPCNMVASPAQADHPYTDRQNGQTRAGMPASYLTMIRELGRRSHPLLRRSPSRNRRLELDGDLSADELQDLDGPLDRFRIEDAPRCRADPLRA